MITREDLIEIINRAWNFRHNSLAAYILAAEPYVPDGKEELIDTIHLVADEDQVLEVALLAALDKLDASPRGRPYEPYVAEFNYLGIDYLTGVLNEKLKEELTTLITDRELVVGYAIGEEELDSIIKTTREQIERMSAALEAKNPGS